MKYFKTYFLIAALINGLNCIGQTNHNSKFIEGSEEFKSMDCKDSCVIVFKDFIVTTIAHNQTPGEDILIFSNKTRKRIAIHTGEEYNAQYFYGLYDKFALIDYGTSSVRKIYIYNLDSKKIINTIEGTNHQAKIINRKLHCWIMMPTDKIKKNKLKEGQCLSEGCGFFEEINYNFKTNKIEFTGKTEWRQ